jgi:tetratricopeptide (TPR) repeat protein
MSYDNLDTEELLRLALDAMNTGRDADSVVLLKTLLEREPGHGYGQYLLAAQHAQLGMMDRAEAGFRAALQVMPELQLARFQLGQLLLVQERGEEAKAVFAPLVPASPGQALGAYARALTAVANEDVALTIRELQDGLDCPQDIPALADDMRRLLARLGGESPPPVTGGSPANPMFLSGYGRSA